ncbi:hypothetical protein IFM89_036866, partial [Coptis chinensis]
MVFCCKELLILYLVNGIWDNKLHWRPWV